MPCHGSRANRSRLWADPGGGSIQETATYESFLESGIQVDVCWRDAGDSPTSTWFPSANGPYKTMTWLNSGTWEIDTARYPKGFKPFSDWVHAHQMQFLLWFEPSEWAVFIPGWARTIPSGSCREPPTVHCWTKEIRRPGPGLWTISTA